MYINDVSILYYVIVGILGTVIGWFIDYCNKIFLKEEKILNKKNFKEYIGTYKPNYILMAIIGIAYIALLYKFGSTDLIKFSMYAFLIPMLLSAFVVDYKEQIIPNRLNLTMFEIGLVFVFIYGMTNLSIAIDMLLGMLVGGGIFLLITLIGGAIAGKEAMGFGEEIIDAIALMTHADDVDYMDYVRMIKENPIAKTVKLADLKHNSDLTRLDHIDEKALSRREKYLKAIAILEE